MVVSATSEKLGVLLTGKGLITPGELTFGLAVQNTMEGRERLGEILCQYDLLNEAELTTVLAEQSGWPIFDGVLKADESIVKTLGINFLREHGVFPIQYPEGIAFVLSDPYDTQATDQLIAEFGSGVMFFIGKSTLINVAIDALKHIKEEDHFLHSQLSVQDAASKLLDEACFMRATDVHIEPSERSVEVRLRIDGVLRFYKSFQLKEHGRLVNIFFNKAEISAGDFLKFHDARFDYKVGDRRIDVRLSHIPSIHGSSLVLRLLDKNRSVVSLESLGYASAHRDVIDMALKKPHGIILLTGPTGCGKTTSLYAMLNAVKNVGLKVVSVEDPVEIRLPLIMQVPVDLKKNHDFHQVTRSFLRHDPDIILIGEVRDEKTAGEAVRAAITGHKVFSTLHTNDAVSAILRLKDLGIDNSYIASTLLCIIAQRLVRKLCLHCRIEEFVTSHSVPLYLQHLLSAPGEIVYRANPQGCPFCFEGYSGRTVVAETLMLDEEMRFMIEQGLVHEISQKVSKDQSILLMRKDAMRLIREGVISLEEAGRVIG